MRFAIIFGSIMGSYGYVNVSLMGVGDTFVRPKSAILAKSKLIFLGKKSKKSGILC